MKHRPTRHANRRASRRSPLTACQTLESRRLLAAIVATTPYNGQQSVVVNANLTVSFATAMNTTTLTADRVRLADAGGSALSATLAYDAGTRTLTLDPSTDLTRSSNYYTLRIAGGSNGVRGSDGTALAGDYVAAFTCGTPSIAQQTVFNGLSKPTNIEFAADGRVFVAEQSGLIKVFDNLSDTTATVVADLRTNVHNFWDRGLLGMALDPNFTTGRPYLYVLYTYDGVIGETAPHWGSVGGSDDAGGTNPSVNGINASARLSRLTVGANGLVSGAEQVLIHDWAQQFPSHSIGDLKFGPDGYLYASGGDGASFNLVDYGQLGTSPLNDPAYEGGALRSQDILSDADPAGLNGTVIRIDPNTGAAAPNNPFATSADANKRRVIANGLRNPFRLTFKPGTNELFIAETGWNTWEEINRIADVGDNVEENFGWPAYEGMGRQPGYEGQYLPLLQGLYNTPGAVTSPWFTYAHTDPVVAGSGEPTGGSTPTGIAFYNGGSYPSAYDGALFFADYARQRIYVMYKGPDGQINQASRQVVDTGGVVELTVGPGGDIFGVNLTSGTVTRLVASGYSHAPVARIAADKTGGALPLVVAFNGTASADPDGAALAYAWDLDGDGNFNDSTSASPTWTYTTAADVTARLRVTDVTGLIDTTTIVIHPANSAPVPTITSPLASVRWKVGDTINFSGTATDAEDGPLAPSRLSWDLVLIHGNDIDASSTHEHRITGFSGVAGGSFVAPDHESPSWLVLRLTATDSRGLSTTTSLRIDPRTVVLNFTSSPAGLKIAFNGTQYVAPFSRTVNAGSTNSISPVSPQTLGATTYTFGSWGQGGAAGQTVVAPDAGASFLATFASSTLVKSSGVVIGTPGSFNNLGDTRDKAFDGDLNTYFDSALTDAWTGLDLGSPKAIGQIRYVPRAGWVTRMVGGAFQGSNDATFATGVTTLYTIPSAPMQGVFTSATINNPATFRYVRYLAPAGGYGNIAELEFYATQSGAPVDATPAAPSGLSATVLPGTQVKLTWTDNATNESGYVLQRRYSNWIWEDLALVVGANDTSAIDTSAYAGCEYEYRLAARNAAGTSGWSAGVTVNTAGTSVPPPAAPSALVATVISAARIDLAWADNSGTETGFRVERRTAGGAFTLIATTGANVRAYVDTGVFAGTAYEYQVTATDGTQTSAASNVAAAATPAGTGTPPAAASALTATIDANRAVLLRWTDNANNETGFVVQRRYTNWIWEDVIRLAANATTYTDAGAYAGAAYEYRIVAVNGSGAASPSNGAIITIPNAGAALLAATAGPVARDKDKPRATAATSLLLL